MMPCAASMAACAFEARISNGANTLSKSIEAFISCSSSPGDRAKRPPHILLAGLSVTARPRWHGAASEPRKMTDRLGFGSKLSARAAAAAAALLAASSGFAAVYVTLGRPDNAAQAPLAVPVPGPRPPPQPARGGPARGRAA